MASSEKTFLGDYDFAVVGSASEGPGLSYVYPGARPADAAAAAKSERVSYWEVAGTRTEANRFTRSDDICVRVHPRSAHAWTGIFEATMSTNWGAHGVVALPDRKNLAVCCHGEVYRACAENPGDWETIVSGVETPPIVLEALELVLFVCFTDIVAWGRPGKAWQTDQPGQLVYDDLRVERIEGDTLQATGSSPPGTTRRYRVDLNTGRSEEIPLGVPPTDD